MQTSTIRVVGLDGPQLAEFRRTGIDHRGEPVAPFVDEAGEWQLRCCLRDSVRGEELVIAAWSPFPWGGPYAETGPVVLHAQACAGPVRDDELPVSFRGRRQVLRPYGHDRRIAYDHMRVVPAEEDLDAAAAALLALDDVAFVHARSMLAGCYSFTVARG